MRDRPFPFARRRTTMPAMQTELCREADLSLRAPGRFVRPRISWPRGDRDDYPIAVVLSEGEWDRALAEALCADGFVVLSLRTSAIDFATIALEWAADHAGELGADPGRLLVVGGRVAAEVALEARDHGWPEVSRQLLVGPDTGDYANRLRDAGVEVLDLSVQGPISFERIRGLTD
jgi:hypothetical protein